MGSSRATIIDIGAIAVVVVVVVPTTIVIAVGIRAIIDIGAVAVVVPNIIVIEVDMALHNISSSFQVQPLNPQY